MTKPQQSQTKKATDTRTIDPAPAKVGFRTRTRRRRGAAAPRCGGPHVLAARGGRSDLWVSDVFFRTGLVRQGLRSSAIASPQMANQVLREYVLKMSSQAAVMLVEQRALEALEVSAWAT